VPGECFVREEFRVGDGSFCVRTYVNLVGEKFRWGHPFCGRQSTQPTSFHNDLKPAIQYFFIFFGPDS